MAVIDVVESNAGTPAATCGVTRTGTVCSAPAGQGTPHPGWGHCSQHAGNTPPGIASAARQEAQAALADLPRFGRLVDITPHEALVFMVRRSAGMVSWLEAKTQSIDDADLVYFNKTETQIPSPWLVLLNEERDRLVRYAKTAADAGVAEREIELAEQQGAMVAVVLRRVLDQLGLDEESQRRANALLYSGLQELGPG